MSFFLSVSLLLADALCLSNKCEKYFLKKSQIQRLHTDSIYAIWSWNWPFLGESRFECCPPCLKLRESGVWERAAIKIGRLMHGMTSSLLSGFWEPRGNFWVAHTLLVGVSNMIEMFQSIGTLNPSVPTSLAQQVSGSQGSEWTGRGRAMKTAMSHAQGSHPRPGLP